MELRFKVAHQSVLLDFVNAAQVILEFPPGSRFWPRDVHLLRSVHHPQWRFLNLEGLRRSSCDILVAHVAPPYAVKIESMSDDEVKQQVMEVLRTMFDQAHTPNNRKATPAPLLIQPDDKQGSTPASSSSRQDFELEDEEKEPAHEEKDAASDALEPLLSDSSDEDADNRKLSRSFRQMQLEHKHEEDRAERPPDNNRWRTRKVCEPLKVIVTRWGRDPFAQGAYCFSLWTQTHVAHSAYSGGWQRFVLSC